MATVELQQQYNNLIISLYGEGFVDEEFSQLRQMQKDNNPHLLEESLSHFSDDLHLVLSDIETALRQKPVKYRKLDRSIVLLDTSSSCVGANRVRNLCITFRAFCKEKKIDGCLQCFEQVKRECYLFMHKIEELIEIERQILSAGGRISKQYRP